MSGGLLLERWRRVRLPLFSVSALFAVYAALAVRRHLTFHTAGWDLGIFEQAIRNYAAFRAPVAVLKGPGYNLLGDHFHPILVVLAPFYSLFPSPITLLVAQAFLFALAAWPLVASARRRLGSRVAVAIGVIYGLSFGIASAVGFDFHEIAFAVPLIAFSLSALGEGRLRAAAAWAAPLVLVKEDLGLTVAVIGILIAVAGRRRLGLLLASFGLGASIIEVAVLLPLINSAGGYSYWAKLAGHPLLTELFTGTGEKLVTLLLTFAISGFIALRSPLAIVAVPTLIWRFTSHDANYWGTDYHYSAVLMPIVAAAMIDGLVRARASRSPLLARLPAWAVAVGIAVSVALVPFFPLSQMATAALWQPNPHAAAVEKALSLVPDNVTVSASDNLVPQLTSRDTVTLFGLRPLARVRPEWIIVDPWSTRHFVVSSSREHRDLLRAEHSGYHVVLRQDGIVLLHRS